ncbi:DNA repair protein RecN [Raoultibacter phocaeensis]|uniref:DNA repair protein RecN n=1 Tax=Raoultibacter phocaeensis TaxID=2479841 RepID=UPI001117BCC5|nr:DNA repair protein RecN [Raoultibacter phocaeensis]
MIDEIHVQNVALIRDAHLVPARGLTVLTGETGAGKTALLSALKLLCGERADAGFVREGSRSLLVEGRMFAEGDLDGTVVSRKVGSDGRSRVSIDGSMASVGELAERVGATVDLCGQHEHQRLLKPQTHVGMLDAWAADSIGPVLAAYQEAFSRARDAADELARIEEAGQASSAKLEEARFVLQRIDEVNPIAGEYEELASALARSEHAESLARAADTAHKALAGEAGAIDAVNAAAAALDSMSGVDEQFGAQASSLREATYVLEDVAREALAYRDSIEYDPDILSENQDRMGALQGLMRTYGPRLEDVLERRAEAAELVSLVDRSAEHISAARKALNEAESVLADAAKALDAARKKAAPRFAKAVSKQMARLEMGGAAIECAIEALERSQWTKTGPSRFEFLFKPAEGLTARPLARIASGGEVSRVMLAIKVVLGETDEVETLVFDEVDAGVGGATAVALASVLADLAQTHQVIVVTHLPQVAVMGRIHYLVAKREDGGDTDGSAAEASVGGEGAAVPETVLVELEGPKRVAEVARMLSGDASEASLAHAREMLERASVR